MRKLVTLVALVLSFSAVASGFSTEFKQEFKDDLQGLINFSGKPCGQVTIIKEIEVEYNVTRYIAACSNGKKHLLTRTSYESPCSESEHC